ncbi:ergothioneine biosynthesis protein EgtB [Sedimenticola selenatireducens]|uniref:Ergothioneine biosynthesis protein EgtB n=1 Tax=Sedimenticola selenatireducens TaxID=191960 RepID=A0A558DUK1_9GAMM|nr:ergothioneine biosynthesis protein EgtB [Sedimenticola selenatireducens]TVO72476.1 ergothioneine biosynthesis protein EgtB [Sedimenticola selenatireducens]TVT64731.1 MAG: ergothioneine biosynthesis protein EgtB [Sedimenticola selenatireducens]
MNRETLLADFSRVRQLSEKLCSPLAVDDYQIQSIVQTSPPKWHLAHVSWFFETFILSHFKPDYIPFHPHFDYLFNSYYYTHGKMQPRPERGLLSRPTVEQIIEYRAHINEQITKLINHVDEKEWPSLADRMVLGLNHEQQHQELLLMDIKHNFFINPLRPAYRDTLATPTATTSPVRWFECEGGLHSIGHHGDGFSFDNETPRHSVLLYDHRLADRLVTNGEYLEFINDGGYNDPALWLADGWTLLQTQQGQHPLYWESQEGHWIQFTLGGQRPLNRDEPVCHLSYYEADAYARWAGKRLPREEELEVTLAEQEITGNFMEDDLLHPVPAGRRGQWYGNLWNWTASPYSPYPGFKPLSGSMGEYNGKFMSSQMVLKGGSCVTPTGHTRSSYRNFFYPDERWMFSGLRLAEDA